MNFSELKAEYIAKPLSYYRSGALEAIERCEQIVKDAIDKHKGCHENECCNRIKQELFGKEEVRE